MKNKLGWCWVAHRNIEAESWNPGGLTRADALKAARKRFKRFCIAPLRAATRKDVRDWCGDHDLRIGDCMVDTDKIEDHNFTKKPTAKQRATLRRKAAKSMARIVASADGICDAVGVPKPKWSRATLQFIASNR